MYVCMYQPVSVECMEETTTTICMYVASRGAHHEGCPALNDLFKIQQERESELLKIQQQREKASYSKSSKRERASGRRLGLGDGAR